MRREVDRGGCKIDRHARGARWPEGGHMKRRSDDDYFLIDPDADCRLR